MEAQIQLILLVILAMAAFACFIFYQNRQAKLRLMAKIRSQYGKRPTREYEFAEFDAITHYFKRKQKEGFYLDDITWNDLDLDTIFMLLNQTYSCVGESYLYALLRTPSFSGEELEARERLVRYFMEHETEREQMSLFFAKVGKTGKKSIFDYIYNLAECRPASRSGDLLCLAVIAAGVASIFLTSYGALLLLGALAFSWSVYYKEKKRIEPYIVSCKCFLEMLKMADKLGSLKSGEMERYINQIEAAGKKFQKFRKNSYFVVSGGDGLTGVLLDYLKLTFHLDLLQFPTLVRELGGQLGEFEILTKNIGELESAIAIASFRTMMEQWCVPSLNSSRDVMLRSEQMYHPMIEDPVKNSIRVDRGVLLTGSNASGKSTFLKTVAINGILAQTIHTCLADSYESSFYQVYTSMALRDDLESQESYYIVEIKSLKRILDHVGEEIPMMCFVDEVLRGTNTVERIAASSQILKSMAVPGVLCFAATHDIELTHILEEDYENYHFQEEVKDHDILFNYKLYEGRAVSRNAIKLLSIIGYQEEIIQSAEDTARRFLETGEWSL